MADATGNADANAKTCTCSNGTPTETPVEVSEFVYSPPGELKLMFPSVDVEQEFLQRERSQFGPADPNGLETGERIYQVLLRNGHLVRAVCFTLSVGRLALGTTVIGGEDVKNAILDAIRVSDAPGAQVILVGRTTTPTCDFNLSTSGILTEQVISYTVDGLIHNLCQQVESAIANPVTRRELFDNEVVRDVFRTPNPRLDPVRFREEARKLYARLIGSRDNAGLTPEDRARNYILIQHPGPYVACAMAADNALTLDQIATVTDADRNGVTRPGTVVVIMTFLNRVTGVPVRLATRIDVSGMWPYVDNSAYFGPTLFGMFPWIQS